MGCLLGGALKPSVVRRACWDAFQDSEVSIRGYAVQAFRVGNMSADAGQDSQGGAISPRVRLSLNETAYNFGNVSLKARRPALLLAAARGAGRMRGDARVEVQRAGLQ